MTVYINGVSDEIKKTLLTTVGDTIYASAVSTPSRLGIGANDSMGQAKVGIPAWRTLAQVITDLMAANLLESFLKQDDWTDLELQGWTEALAGTGSSALGPRRIFVDSGTTAASSALRQTPHVQMGFQANNGALFNFSKAGAMLLRVATSDGTANGISRVTLGKNAADGAGALVRAGLGISILNRALKGIAYDGGTETTIDLATTMNAGVVHKILVTWDGAGNVEWFVAGVSKGTTAAGPSAANATALFQVEALNGADSAAQSALLYVVKVLVRE